MSGETIMSEGEIFSSTGGLGCDVRQDDRLYENADLYDMRSIMVAERFADLLEDPRSKTENISRWVLRGVVNDEAMAAIQADRYGMRQDLEVALPLAEFGRAGYAAGFRIPSHQYGNQILPDHVTVNDDIEQAGLRHFSMMYLPEAAFHSSHGYDPRQTDRILDRVNTES